MLFLSFSIFCKLKLSLIFFLPERCLPGMYFDDAKNKCVPCGYGFYQPNEGAFICISCGLDLTTKSDTAVSFQECKGKNLCYNGRLSNYFK